MTTHHCDDCKEDIHPSSLTTQRFDHSIGAGNHLVCSLCGSRNIRSINNDNNRQNDANNDNNADVFRHLLASLATVSLTPQYLEQPQQQQQQPSLLMAQMAAAQRGVNIDQLMEQLMNDDSRRSPPTSKEFVETLQLCSLSKDDFRQVCLEEINVGTTQRTIFATSADGFGRQLSITTSSDNTNERVRGRFVVSDAGATVNRQQFHGAIVLMPRGVISFADKASIAQQYGAVCVVVIQTLPTWPFRMTDSVRQHTIDIPVCMVSERDGASLMAIINANKDTPTTCSMACRTRISGCPVCREEFHEQSEVLTLPCFHQYCRECLLPWLAERNTCPLCRYELPAEPSAPKETTNHNQVTLHNAMFT